MTTQPHAEGFHQNTGRGPGRSPASIQTHSTTPEFRTKVIEILSRTANGCLQELNYRPGMAHKLAELQNRVNHFQEENKKLFEDNKRLTRMAKTIQEKQVIAERFYTGTIHSLEQQVLAMQRENQETLNREARLAAGHLEYARLQSEYARLHGCCAQLRQQIATLQKILLEKPPLPPQLSQQVMVPGQQNRMMASGQPNAVKPSIPQSVQEALEKQQQQQLLARGQRNALPGRQIVNGQQAQAQTATSRQARPHISIPHVSGASMLNASRSQPNTPNASPGLQSLMQVNQILLNHKTPAPSIPRPSSSSSRHSNDIMEVDSQGSRLPGSKPVVHGWTSGASSPDIPLSSLPPAANTTMHTQLHSMPPRRQASAPSVLPRQNAISPTLPTSPSTPYAGPVNSGALPGPRYHPVMINPSPNIPVVDPQPPPGFGMNVVPIGPPGKLLPPLTASVMGPSSSSTSTNPPSFAHAPSISKRTAQTSPSIIDLTNTPPAQPQAPSLPSQGQPPSPASVTQNESNADHLQTPNLTPSSSRNSAVPSEGVPEVVTPLDVPVGHAFDVVGSPGTGAGSEAGTARVRSPVMGKVAMKRGSTRVSSEEEEITGNDEVSKKVVGNEAISLKRGSIHIAGGDEEEGEIPHTEGVRKKPRLEVDTDVASKNIPSDVNTATPAADGPGVGTANGHIQAEPTMDEHNDEGEEDEDEEEEDEIGPDGLRTIKYCLDAFTDEDDNGVSTCVLCLKRHEEGLIEKPATFSPDMTQEGRLQHFLSEHSKVWEDFRHQRRFG